MTKARPFLAYDGESSGRRYVLLANSNHYVYARNGLSTETCLHFLTAAVPRNPLRIFYGLSFDVAHITNDIPDWLLVKLWHAEPIDWNVYHLAYIPGKRLTVTLSKRSYTYYDVSGFYGQSFIRACETFGIALPKIVYTGKKARGHFSRWRKQRLIDYNLAECQGLEQLAAATRASLDIRLHRGVSLLPRTWHGIGAVASTILHQLNAGGCVYPEHKFMPGFQQLLATAYFGGRIENTVAGSVAGPIYRYDMHSAYAWALAQLPRVDWRWERVSRILIDHNAAIYHLRWDLRNFPALHEWPGPLPWRDREGYIIFRAEGEGWYWAPEAERVIAYYPNVEVLDGYAMADSGQRPLRDTILELFQVKREEEEYGSPTAGLIKRAVNSMYGKTIQRTFGNRYYSLVWAGLTTSLIRARMLDAIRIAPRNILASLTDGLITAERLNLKIGPGLGEWEETEYNRALILAPGVYKLEHLLGTNSISRWRGFTVKVFPFARVLREVKRHGESHIAMPLFVSPIMAILAPGHYGRNRNQFIFEDRAIAPLHSHKRYFYRGLASKSPKGADLAHSAIRSRLVMGQEGERPPMSWMYRGDSASELEQAERQSLELTAGLWGD